MYYLLRTVFLFRDPPNRQILGYIYENIVRFHLHSFQPSLTGPLENRLLNLMNFIHQWLNNGCYTASTMFLSTVLKASFLKALTTASISVDLNTPELK